MKTVSNDQIERLLDDISEIKSVINRNKPVLQEVFNPGRYRLFFFLTGMSYIGFSLLIYFLMRHYGSFGAIPGTLRITIYVGIVADFGFLQILKRRSILASVRNVDQNLTIGWLFKELFSYRIVHLYVPLMVLVIFLSVYFIVKGNPSYIVPTIAIFYGLLTNFMGTIFEIKQSLIVGYWLIITGILALIFSSIPPLIALSMTLGCGMLIYSISGSFSLGSEEVN